MSISIISFQTPNPPPLPTHRFTVEQYHRMGESGVLTADDRVELLEGWIVKKMNHRPAHGFAVRVLDDWLQSIVPTGWLVQCQLPITLSNSEPEPDLAIVRGLHSDFRDRHPGGNACRLLIEVADTSLAKDRAKAAIYAAAGIEEYWIVNLIDRQLEKMTQPVASEYSETATFGVNETVEIQLGQQSQYFRLSVLFDAPWP